MKHYSETKKTYKIALILMLASLLNFSPVVTRADTATDALNAQKSDLQNKLDSINAQIKIYQQQIATTQAKSSTLQNEISIYDKQIASTQLEIEANQTETEDVNLQIDEVTKLIAQKEQDIEDNKQVLAQLIVQMNEYDNEYALQTTFGSSNLSDFLDQIQYASSYSDQIDQLVKKIKDLKAQLQVQQTNLQTHLKRLQDLQAQLKQTQDSLNEQKQQKQKLLTQTKGIEKNFQKLLAGSKQDQDNLQKEVNDLDAQIRAKLGNKHIIASKGILAWPIDGIVTQGYGNTGFTALGYTSHNGIDIAGPAGTPVYAAADGVVFDTDHSNTQYGNWVAIKHNLPGNVNIVTLYGHMRSFIVSPGQKVSQGDLIGYEGNTGNTTAKLYGPERGYHVHFGVYDQEGFSVTPGAYQKLYGPYKIPYGYTYNPLDFLGGN